jgi:ribonuclease HII
MNRVVGIDEVGRGAWAGPLLVVAARQLITLPEGVNDSKQTSKSRRSILKVELENCCQFGEGWVKPSEIDKWGLSKSMRVGVKRALEALLIGDTEEIIIDGNINYCPANYVNSECLIKADETIPIVSAASIYAKVTRDSYMKELGSRFKSYGFEEHVGYGTKKHIEALRVYGMTDFHRKSYKPIKRLLNASN